ncbi:MAG: FAD-dependent oxidoreductase [Zetaproteobacteria bacterium]|nr:MAG: FAD-dependent oxidoreductase [Zetaproteobacteria bacterium]
MKTVAKVTLTLAHGLSFEDLYRLEGLKRIDDIFLTALAASDEALHARLHDGREHFDSLGPKEHSALLMDLAPHLETFLAELFGIRTQVLDRKKQQLANELISTCKRRFIQRAIKGVQVENDAGEALIPAMEALCGAPFDELRYASQVLEWIKNPKHHAHALETAARYAAWAVHTRDGRAHHADGVLFKLPHNLDFMHLVSVVSEEHHGIDQMRLPGDMLKQRRGFKLTDPGCNPAYAMDQAHYCIWCHKQDRDSCSKGLKEKRSNTFSKSPLGVTLTGCPLEEKISEMNLLMAEGCAIGALAAVVVDNPMVAGTGHRICNDCMKSCIYQRQDPVDIPQIETRMLREVLELPWGFEIYSLLTRWNPLNIERPLLLEDSGYKVLVVGLGPAGYTLAHHLMNDGHRVVAIDGLKIEPLPPEICGVTVGGVRAPFQPIHDIHTLHEELDERVMAGFGGVAEYGITVRWDKNFLKVIRLLLERRERFTMFDGVRFGGTLTVEDAFTMGFDHIALCMGAGKPTFLSIPNGMARGVRKASDFLMALQLTGAVRESSVANLQIRLPAVVIGGGLTAVDTATEVLAYYPVQVEKFLSRYEALAHERGEDAVRAPFSVEETLIADEFMAHARAIRAERAQAATEGREPDILSLLDHWGGVSIVYRRRLIDAPSYILNHEELTHALAEGIRFAELLSPVAVDIDAYGHAQRLRLSKRELNPDGHIEDAGDVVHLPARAILIAAGTHPNTALAEEDAEHVKLDGYFFQAVDMNGQPVQPERIAKPAEAQMLMNVREDGRAMSFFGDLHPSFAGNVVKAMASARRGHKVVSRALLKNQPGRTDGKALIARLNDQLRPRTHAVRRLAPNIVEVVVHAPKAASAFRPGQFYRLQNYETLARQVDGTRLVMEGLALTGASVNLDQGLISLIVMEMGGSSDLCAQLKPGEPVVLMGPTGSPTEICEGETVLLAGGGLGNAVLFSIGQAFRKAGSRVLYFAGYKKIIDRYKVEEIEAAADVVVWCSDEAPGFTPTRPQDTSFVGNIVEAMDAYANGGMGEPSIPLIEIDRLIAIGSAGMMAAVARARHGTLKGMLKPDHVAIGSINSPMQCMMKGICAQCLQVHRDPETDEETMVFSCANQDQLLDWVDFSVLMERLGQQSVQEKLTVQWIDHCLVRIGIRNG